MERSFESELFTGDDLAVVRGGRLVFADLSFSVEPRAALRLAGPNGSGKSTLIRVMAEGEDPDRVNAIVDRLVGVVEAAGVEAAE